MTKEQFDTIIDAIDTVIDTLNRKNAKPFYSPHSKRKYLGEVNDHPSETVPGQAMTVKDMLVRYNNGQAIPQDERLKYPVDDTEEPLPAFADLTDIDAVKAHLAELTKRMEQTSVKTENVQENARKQEKPDEKQPDANSDQTIEKP